MRHSYSLSIVVVVGGLQHFSVSPRPLGFWFGTKGFGAKGLRPGLDNWSFSTSIRITNLLDTDRCDLIRSSHKCHSKVQSHHSLFPAYPQLLLDY